MKREKFLWPLSQSHHRALLAARRVKEQLSSGPADGEGNQLGKMSSELKKFYKEELCQHFWDEERILSLFEGRMGNGDPDAERIRKEHRFLGSFLSQNTKVSLLQFSETLVLHIRFEEDIFFERIEKIFNESDIRTVGEILQHPSVSSSAEGIENQVPQNRQTVPGIGQGMKTTERNKDLLR